MKAIRYIGMPGSLLGIAVSALLFLVGNVSAKDEARIDSQYSGTPTRPNVILCMADDLGWGDVGYNGNTIIKTPHLDQMAREGARFDRFYAVAPLCSPTRASCLTGRHPYRIGVFSANTGMLRQQETTIDEILRAQGYRTGHFGKWHLGTFSADENDGNRGGDPALGNPPDLHGFDTHVSTESKVPTWDPMKTPRRSGCCWRRSTRGTRPARRVLTAKTTRDGGGALLGQAWLDATVGAP